MKNYTLIFGATFVAASLAGCAHNVPTESNTGYVYDLTISACRSNGTPNDQCVAKDLRRCKALVDYANPGRDESTYMGIIDALSTITGTAIGYDAAGITGRAFSDSMKVVGGEMAGSGLGTALSYNKVLWRSSVEACMYSYGRDPKLTEQYFGSVSYTGKVQSLDSVLPPNERRKQ